MNRPMIFRAHHFALFIVILFIAGVTTAQVKNQSVNTSVSSGDLHLAHAVMCGAMEAFKPVNRSTVFSVNSGKVMCFREFDRVPLQTEFFHDWIKHGELVFRKKLVLKPPRWSSVSSIQLREADKGPWRVEIRNANGKLIKLMRFSITD